LKKNQASPELAGQIFRAISPWPPDFINPVDFFAVQQ